MTQEKLKDLLNYSTSLQTSSATPATDKKLDTSFLDAFLGPDDAKLMLSSMQAVEDPTIPPAEAEIAFENLEALVEQIDNANNLENLKLWPPLLKQLGKENTIYRLGACAVIATAVQNNAVSQNAFLKHDGIRIILAIFQRHNEDKAVRRKALFAITSTLRNNSNAYAEFTKVDGWKAISELLDESDADIQLLKRTAFFLRTIYDPNEPQDILPSDVVRTGFPPKLVHLLDRIDIQDDEDTAEKILQTLSVSLVYDRDVLNLELKKRLKALSQKLEERYGSDMCDFEGMYAQLPQ